MTHGSYNWRNWLHGILVLALFFTLLIPFYVNHDFHFPYIDAKNILFRGIINISLVPWLILLIFKSDVRPQINLLIIAVLIYITATGVSDYLGVDPHLSLWSTDERMEGFATSLYLLAYFLMMCSLFTKKIIWEIFWWGFVIASVIISIIGITQMNEVARISATIGNAGFFAGFLIFSIFITGLMWLHAKNYSRFNYGAYLFCCVALIIEFIALYLTATRGAILGLLCGIFSACFIALFINNLRSKALLIVAGLGLIVGGFFVIKNTPYIKESYVLQRFNDQEFSSSAKVRLQFWAAARQGFMERKWLGYGQENFTKVYQKYVPVKNRVEPNVDRAHNIIFDRLIESGIIGLTAYLAIFLVVFYYLYRSINVPIAQRLVLFGLIVAYFVQNLLLFDTINTLLPFYAILAYIQFIYLSPNLEANLRYRQIT